MILGISGPNAAGKGAVLEFLEASSFAVHSLSDVIREELARRSQPETREAMIALGRELRAADGPGALATRIVERLGPERNHAVDSIRHPAEVEVLKGCPAPFRLLWIDAPIEVRFERLRRRGRPGDPTSIEELERLERAELGSSDVAAQQLLAVKEQADATIENTGDIAALHDALRSFLKKELYFERPSWDAYFMSIAQVVASRSNCVKRKVAAVITMDRRIISTGYNGTPRGVRNCNEGGCPRCNSFAPGGSQLSECVCSHGEENAIVQAAYHGVSLRGGMLYSTFCPCLLCTKMIINAGLSEVVYNAHYPLGDVSLDLLREAGIKVRQFTLEEPG